MGELEREKLRERVCYCVCGGWPGELVAGLCSTASLWGLHMVVVSGDVERN